jgi:hypothetical protein
VTVTPETIENEVRRLARKLEERTDELAVLFRAAAEADVAYRVAYAKALLASNEKTVGRQEADATVKTADLLQARKIAEALAESAKESTRSLRDQISAVQSVGAMLRAQMALGG